MLVRKILISVAILLILVVVAVLGGFFYVKGRGLPRREGTARLPGLGGEVAVRWDRWAVPHVKAGSEEDLAAAVGYLHANDRMVQLELGRRSCTGRLAQLIGSAALPLDERSRHLRLRATAEKLEAAAGETTRRWLEAYARGVNAWLTERGGDMPPELVVLGVEPEPWTPTDSLCFVVLMARDLSIPGFHIEDGRYILLSRLGLDRARDLIGYEDLHVPPGLVEKATADGGEPADEVAEVNCCGAREAVGSNNWAVGVSRTTTGAPLVANDPHLRLGIPSTWYQVMLRAPGLEVAGMTIPGLPVVVVGQTPHLAWAVTNTQLDDTDLYIEELDEAGERVRRGEEWVPITVEEDTIPLRGGETEAIELRTTDRGPLLPAVERFGLPPRSIDWTAYEASDPLSAFLGLARAVRVEEVPEAVAGYVAPAQNLVVADREGGLLYTLLGRVPERRTGDGRLPAPGWSADYGWEGLRPAADNPRVLGPEDDLLVTANNDVVPADYPLPVYANYDRGAARARRIRQLLAPEAGWDAQGMAEVQQDTVSLYARELIPLLAGEYEGDARRAYEALTAWDGDMTLSGAPALFVLVERELALGLFADEARQVGLQPFGTPVRVQQLLAGEMDPIWFDDVKTSKVETREEQIAAALERAWGKGRGRWGPKVEAWNYGILHPLLLRHPLGVLPVVGSIFNRGPVPVPGSPNSVVAFTGLWQGENQQTVIFGPSMRWVADLADPDHSLAMLLPGQSGHLSDAHYDDQLQGFAAGEIRPVAWSEEAIAGVTVSTLTLEP